MARNVLGCYKTSGIPVRQPGASSFGSVIFADADNGNDESTGNSPTNAVESIEQAVDQAAINGVDATIIARKGFYSPDEVIALTSSHNGLRLIADNLAPNMARASTMIYNIGGPDQQITLNGCHNVEIGGFRFYPEMGTGVYGIQIAPTSGAYGTWIHDNIFYNLNAANMACSIQMGAAGVEASYTMIEDNFFHNGGTQTTGLGIITWTQATRSMIRKNYFHHTGNNATRAAVYIDSSVDNPRGFIVDNEFNFAGEAQSDSVAYAIYHGAAYEGMDFHISGNKAINYAVPFEPLSSEAVGLNYAAGTAVTIT